MRPRSGAPNKQEETVHTLTALIERHGVEVHDYLDRAELVPVLGGLQFQGDVAVVPAPSGTAGKPVPAAGVPVVRGESGGNTHLLLADGEVLWAPGAGATALDLGAVNVPAGATAWLAHPEHGYLGIGPGSYWLRRQREQADEIRLVQD
jgi:hypothetical protein